MANNFKILALSTGTDTNKKMKKDCEQDSDMGMDINMEIKDMEIKEMMRMGKVSTHSAVF